MRRGLVLASIGLCSCDAVWRLDHVDRHDAAPIDAEIDAGEACRADYEEVSDTPRAVSRYRFVNTYTTWPQAEGDCEDDSLTGITHQVVFDDLLELRGVRNYIIAKVVFETGGAFQAFAGYGRNLADDPKQFYAVTGEALPTNGPPWEGNEPNNGMGMTPEPIVWFSRDYDLIDGPSSITFVYVCECDHRPVTKSFTID